MSALRRLAGRLRLWRSVAVLPPRVARFYLRAYREGTRRGDSWSIASRARPAELRRLIGLARGHDETVEIGTGTAWTSIALALADRDRVVRTYDPIVRPERELYLALIPPRDRARIELVEQSGEDPPADPGRPGLLFIDSSHEREETANTFRRWQSYVRPGGVVCFHDYGHPDFPGVAEAVVDLGLEGRDAGGMFVWRKPG
jgi:predicted O-methyltransferase YrrM